MTLADLSPGETGRITHLRAEGPFALRLMALGFTPGTRIKCLFFAPLGDPVAYRVRRTVICLRRDDAARIQLVRTTEGEIPHGSLWPDPVRPGAKPLGAGVGTRAPFSANHPL